MTTEESPLAVVATEINLQLEPWSLRAAELAVSDQPTLDVAASYLRDIKALRAEIAAGDPKPNGVPPAESASPVNALAETEVGPLVRSQTRAAARMLAEAFLDDPAWSAGSPRRRGHRKLANRASFRALLALAHRCGATVQRAGAGAAVEGVAVSFDPGRWPPARSAGASRPPGRARPRALSRQGIRRSQHPRTPHR